jgi:hypothetical protein
MANIIDKSYNQETGELQQFTIITDDGQPQLVKANDKNVLLYDPENELPFDDGLYGFLNGDDAILLSQNDPEVIVAPTENEYCYVLRVGGNTIETTPRQAENVLSGVKSAAIDGDIEAIVSVYDDVIANQVRRPVVNKLLGTFEKDDRIQQTGSGWLIDDFYLVDWEASMYTKNDDPDENDVMRSGSGVVETDRSYEFIEVSIPREIDPIEVGIGGETFRLTEREMLFLSKVKWLLNRREHHADIPFWKWTDKRASVDWRTGEPEDDDEPDLDSFEL